MSKDRGQNSCFLNLCSGDGKKHDGAHSSPSLGRQTPGTPLQYLLALRFPIRSTLTTVWNLANTKPFRLAMAYF